MNHYYIDQEKLIVVKDLMDLDVTARLNIKVFILSEEKYGYVPDKI